MKRPLYLIIPLLLVVAFSLAASLQPWSTGLNAGSKRAQDPLSLLLGDARKMFANHFFVKADVYFHSGYYPSIYDNRESFRTPHIAEDAGAREGRNTGDEDHFLGHHRDWIDAFGRRFFPSVHTHLNEGGAETNSEDSAVREILPWLKLSASLDPERVDTYTVAAFWLRKELNKVDEAEEFLREGLRANPGNPLILFELGRICCDDRHDTNRARNVWEMGIRRWDETQAGLKEPDLFTLAQLLGNLAKLEESCDRKPVALALLRRLKSISPYADGVQKWIDEVSATQARDEKPGSVPRG